MELPEINQRIKKLINAKAGGSERKFAELCGLGSSQKLNRIFHPDKRSGNYPSPSIDIVINIANKFAIDLNWLLGIENEKSIVGEETPAPYHTKSKMPTVITVDSEGKENITLVPIPAQAGYLDRYHDEQFLEKLPTYRLPSLSNGTFRMFEVAGHSMFPTIHAGAYAIGEWVEDWEEDIKDNRIYIIVHKEDGIVVKRCLNRLRKYGNLFLKSDNRTEYPSYPVKKEEIREVWSLKTALIFDFQYPADLYNRMSELEAEILQIKAKNK